MIRQFNQTKIREINMNELYESQDFYACSFLVAAGVPLKMHTRLGHITTFVFNNTSQVEDLLSEYYSLQAVVNPATYATAIKNLKSIIHGAYNNTHSNTNHNTNHAERNKT